MVSTCLHLGAEMTYYYWYNLKIINKPKGSNKSGKLLLTWKESIHETHYPKVVCEGKYRKGVFEDL